MQTVGKSCSALPSLSPGVSSEQVNKDTGLVFNYERGSLIRRAASSSVSALVDKKTQD